MARGINKAILVGNAGNDPETKYTQGGMAVTTVSLATTSVKKDRDGNKVEQTQWHKVKFFDKLAEIVGEYVKKGSQLYVEGEIRYDKYTDRDGAEKYFTEIIGNQMQLLGGRSDDQRSASPRRQQSAPRREAPPRQRQAPPEQTDGFEDDFADDDIPF